MYTALVHRRTTTTRTTPPPPGPPGPSRPAAGGRHRLARRQGRSTPPPPARTASTGRRPSPSRSSPPPRSAGARWPWCAGWGVSLIGAAVNGAALGGWALAMTSGISFVDGLETAEDPQFPDLLAAALAVVAILGAVAALASTRRRQVGSGPVLVGLRGRRHHGSGRAGHGGDRGPRPRRRAMPRPRRPARMPTGATTPTRRPSSRAVRRHPARRPRGHARGQRRDEQGEAERACVRRLDRRTAVDGLAERADDAADERLADGHARDAAGSATVSPPSRVLQLPNSAVPTLSSLRLKAMPVTPWSNSSISIATALGEVVVDAGDAVTDLEHGADLGEVGLDRVKSSMRCLRM